MAATYDPEHSNALSRVRFALGDFDLVAGTLLSDEAILAAIEARGEAGATAWLAQGLATMFAYQPDKKKVDDGPSVEYSRVKVLQGLATSVSEAAASFAVSRPPRRETSYGNQYGDDGEYTTPRGVGWDWSTSPYER